MSYLLNRLATVFSLGAIFIASAHAATNPHIAARPQARIVQKVDNAKLMLLTNTHPARVAGLVDMGRVSSSTQFSHMILVLKSTDTQEYALQSLLDQQQDKSSPNYHQWMNPVAFGQAFGTASSDIAQVTNWLQDSGFSIDSVAKGARIIQFSGTSGQVEAAFHTEMHNYMVDGELRTSNATDVSIPEALSPVVAGLSSLNNFRMKSNMVGKRTVVPAQTGTTTPSVTGASAPEYTSLSSGSHYVGAADLATIFNTNPLLNAGINGSGVKVAILGETDILLGDVQIYRQLFKLPLNNPNFIQIGGDPGTIADDGESDLDVELSGGIAPMATIDFYLSGNSYFGGGIDASGVYVVENNTDDIISLSYGECETSLGASGNAFYQELWEQAASQGQSVFVSSGDAGPAACDNDDTQAYATHGYNVSGLGSTPFNVAVGGTMFNDGVTGGGAVAPYWGPGGSAPYESALSYIPEIPWNEGAFDTYSGGYGGIVAGTSGISFYYQTPGFQTGPGVPAADPTPLSGSVANKYVVAGPHRYIPDVSLIAAGGHDGTIFCSEGSCLINSDGTVASLGLVGGTSVAAPSMAGVQALIDQANGGRQGNPNFFYYRAAALQSTTNCVSATYVSTASCSFHDITTGTNKVPTNAADTTYIGWGAAAGYDLAVGLGSPDVTNLATNWKSITFNATTTAFTLTPTTSTHGATYDVTINVTPVSGSGTPTGDVSIIAQALYGGLGNYTLSGGAASVTLTGLPGGTYNVYAHYAGDTTYGGSNSAPIQVTVSSETSQVNTTSYVLTTGGGLNATTTYTYGSNIYFDSGVSSPSGIGTPSGTVTYSLNNGTITLPTLTNKLDSFDDTYFDSGLGYAGYDIAPNYPVLPTGTYVVSTSYSGDTTFNASTGTPFTIVVGPANQTLTLRAATATVASGGTATLTASITTIAPTAGGVPATGTVTFTDNTKNVLLATGTLVNGAVTVNTNLLVTSGAHSITATYSGDANYLTKTSSAVTITVGGSASTTTLSITPTTAQVGTTVALKATVPTSATGTIYFYDAGTYLGTANVSSSTHTATLNVSTFGAATHSITATYNGNTTLDTSTSVATPLVITQNTPSVQLSTQAASSTGTSFAMNALLIPSPAGTKPDNPAPTGVIQFLDAANGGTATVLGSATAAYLPGGYENYVAGFTTPALKPGYHNLTANYVGDTNYASALSNVQGPIAIGITTLNVTSSTTNVGTGILFTLKGIVTPVIPSSTPITGSVTFYSGTTVVGTAMVSGGVATLTTAKLAGTGTATITAIYSGDANYYTSSFTTGINIVVVTPGFTIAANPTSLTVAQGSSASATITATSYGNYYGTGPMSCIGLPANATCLFTYSSSANPPSFYTFSGADGTQTATVTIMALKPHAVRGAGFTSILWLPAALLAGFLGLRRKQVSVRGRQFLLLAILLCGTLATTACSSLSMATPAGTSTVTIIANGVGAAQPGTTVVASPNIQPTTTITLTVTQ